MCLIDPVMRMLSQMRDEAKARYEAMEKRLDNIENDMKSMKNSLRLLTDNSESSRHQV